MINIPPSGFSTTRGGKQQVLQKVANVLLNSTMLLSFPASGITSVQMTNLKNYIPIESKAMIVKNTLMNIAVNNTIFDSIMGNVKGQNLYIFVPEGEYRTKTYAGYTKWLQETFRRNKCPPKFALFESRLFYDDDIKYVANLPSKEVLMSKIFNFFPQRLLLCLKNIIDVRSKQEQERLTVTSSTEFNVTSEVVVSADA